MAARLHLPYNLFRRSETHALDAFTGRSHLMAPQLFKKYCAFCNKSFLTYENDKIYCNDKCINKQKYRDLAYKNDWKIKYCQVKESRCEACSEIISVNDGRGRSRKWCNDACRKLAAKRKRMAVSNVTDKKKSGHPLPYEVLNEIEEKKRVFVDSKYRYQYNRPRI